MNMPIVKPVHPFLSDFETEFKVALTDLPPSKWSSLKYDFRTEDKINGEEELYG
jgi:hypothetical protein